MRHHYVPQFLLRSWADRTPDNRVETFRLDLPSTPSSRRGPKHVGYEDDLYALTLPEVAGMEQQAVETRLLRIIDQQASIVLTKLITSGFSELTEADGQDWARFLMSLRLRQPDIIAKLRTDAANELERSLAESPEEYDALSGPDNPPTLLEWTQDRFPGLIENIGMSFFHKLVDNAEVGEKLLRLRWWLLDFKQQKHDLLLADHPCIFTAGIDDPDFIVALPIAPRKVFLATRRTDRMASVVRRHPVKEWVMRLNEQSLGQARARVYALDRKPARFIRNRIANLKAAPFESVA